MDVEPWTERQAQVHDALVTGERLIEQLDELGLSLAAAFLAMSMDIVAQDERGTSTKH